MDPVVLAAPVSVRRACIFLRRGIGPVQQDRCDTARECSPDTAGMEAKAEERREGVAARGELAALRTATGSDPTRKITHARTRAEN
jgi:hypothetical protein